MKLYITAVIDFEISHCGRTVRLAKNAENRALHKELRAIAFAHADAACKEMGQLLQLAEKQKRLF